MFVSSWKLNQGSVISFVQCSSRLFKSTILTILAIILWNFPEFLCTIDLPQVKHNLILNETNIIRGLLHELPLMWLKLKILRILQGNLRQLKIDCRHSAQSLSRNKIFQRQISNADIKVFSLRLISLDILLSSKS